jgi:starch synthase (maltosyl-transferring)
LDKRRVVIENVRQDIDVGRFPAKRATGETVVVEADIFGDGHDSIACDLRYRAEGKARWSVRPMNLLVNDRWRAEFTINDQITHRFTIEAWVDPFSTWRADLVKRIEAGQDITIDLLIGADLVKSAAGRASRKDGSVLKAAARAIAGRAGTQRRAERALDEVLASLMRKHADRSNATRLEREIVVEVDRPQAAFSTWYEMFPRSASSRPGEHGTFKDVEKRLSYVKELGFDVLYLPPIHPIGRTHRKGKNNAVVAARGDGGRPRAIGSREGGHKAVHPQLGTLEDFRRLVKRARQDGIEIALDIAFQCSPDHPYVKKHPQWFKMRPDGTVQYAENAPKKYEDIYPFDFDTGDWEALWHELRSIFLFWIDQGVRIFRVDNPHTKPFRFWEWLICAIKADHPEIIFLAEAFTRPKIMYRLAKLGFTQSYTYFAWRNTKWELTEYFTELTQTPVSEFFRPNVWTNTPDILTEYLQSGGRPAFMIRLVLAATLSANYGLYGPAFELMENVPREPGSEEYLNSEKYEVKHWDLNRPASLREFIAWVNRIRHENRALQGNFSLRFHNVDNDQIICYSKATGDGRNIIISIVNLDPRHTQSGWVSLPIDTWGIADDERYEVHDLLGEARYHWRGARNYVELNPYILPAHILRLHRPRNSDA